MTDNTRPEGAKTKSGFGFVARRVRRDFARLVPSGDWCHGWIKLRIVLALSLSFLALMVWLFGNYYTLTRAQQITPQAGFDAAMHLASDQHFHEHFDPEAQKRKQEAQARENLERYQRLELYAIALRRDQDQFINEVEMEKGLRKFNTQIPAGEETGYRYSTNSYGANYSVPNGSYRGDGLIGLKESWIPDTRGNPMIQDRTITQGRDGDRSIGNGWSFEPGGFLKEEYHTVNVSYDQFSTHCSVVLRYTYASANGGSNFQQRGIEQAINFDLKGSVGAYFCASAGAEQFRGLQPTQFWSDDGQIALDMSDSNQPVMRYPDGTFLKLSTQPNTAYIPFNAGLYDYLGTGAATGNLWFLSQSVSRNGQITNYTYDGNGWLKYVDDFRGRRTEYVRDGSGRLQTITAPGPGGTLLSWHMTWEDRSWDPANEFQNGEIQCLFNANPAPCTAGPLAYTTLTKLQLPDSRSYTFSYGPWGNLTRVIEPDGAIRDFEYGGSTTTAFLPPGEILGVLGTLPAYTLNLQKRRVTATTIYPQGLTGAAFRTTYRHDNTQDLGTSAQCSTLLWIKTTYPNGDFGRQALCSPLPDSNPGLNGKTFAQEIWNSSGSMLSAAYYGNLGTFGDTSVPVGTMYVDAETSHDPIQANGGVALLDVRPNKVVHFKDGVTSSEEFKYEQSNIQADGQGVFRTTGNVTIERIRDTSGSLMSKSETTYFHNGQPAYIDRNLLRLPSSAVLKDGTDHVLSRTDYLYDQFTPTASGAPNLDTSILNVRGNVTTVKSYRDAVGGLLPVSAETRYFDTGDVQQTFDPLRRNPTTSTYTFGLCSSNLVLTNTVTNVLGQQTKTASDCFSGLTLSVTDPNGQSGYSQYDVLGRLFETAGPGDTLTPITGLIRDPNIPQDRLAGSLLGNGGQGPTTWNEYFRFGLEVSNINQQRTVTHLKDGTADGHYVKAFVDGLGRTLQTRSEIDPATSGGNAENVTTTDYDNMGRVSASYVPCFSSQADTFAPCTTLATTTQYDALGRVTTVTPPGLPATTNYYFALGSKWRTMVSDAMGHQSDVVTDVLGHIVKTSRSWIEGGKMACVDPELGMLHCATTMDVDAAGRLKSTTDPSGNVMSFVYDGLGRKTDMTDPDMGVWHYEYDDNGNLTSQTDAKGQVITMQYDVLNRIILKDLPPTGMGEEDLKYFYDGDQPPTCYSCDDHNINTQDCCDPATGTCYHQAAGTACGSTACSYTLSASSASFPSGGGSGSVNVNTSASCTWAATTATPWIHINTPSGTGPGPVNYSVDANTGAARNGTMTIAGQTFTVNEDALSCSYTLSASTASFPASGGNGSVTVTTSAGCSWTANGSVTWIHINNVSGSGTTTITYSVDSNSGIARSGILTIGGQTLTVNQAGGCTYSLSPPNNLSVPPAGVTGAQVTVNTNAGCTWTAVSNANWIHIAGSASGTGTGTITCSVDANNTPARTGSMTIAGQTFTVNQAGGCTYSLSPPNNLSVPPAGVTGAQVTVNTNAGCTWTAGSNALWIAITGGSSGSGTGTVTYNVQPNSGAMTRSGSMTIAGLTFNVSQDACGYFIQPTSEVFASSGTGETIQVSAQGGCTWSAQSNVPWITITAGASGSGSGTVSITVTPNTTTTYPNNRTGTLTIAGLTFTATQYGQPTCPNSAGISCNPDGSGNCAWKCFTSTGGSGTFYYWPSRPDCDSTAHVDVTWIRNIVVTNLPNNSKKVTYSVDPNNFTQRRVGVITINTLTHTVSEGGSDTSASGRVTTTSGQGLAGVTITFGAVTPYPGLPAPVVTDANGYWSQSGFLACKNNFAEASKSGYMFSPRSVGFNPGGVHVDCVANSTQASNGLRFENIVRAASLNPTTSVLTKETPDEDDTSSDRSPTDKQTPRPHDPAGLALLGCVVTVFTVRLYKLRRQRRRRSMADRE